MNTKQKLKTALLIVLIVLNSCKKKQSSEVDEAQPINNDLISRFLAARTKDSNTYLLDSIDLNSINFTPSTKRIVIKSDVTGYWNGSLFNNLSLTDHGWTHPSVLYFKQGWQGHNYWMAITPYPNSDSQFENPYIFCSDDGINWEAPVGVKNPFEAAPNKPVYNSDVNLQYDNGKLYCYWRQNGNLINKVASRTIFERHSDDGINWSEKTYVASWHVGIADAISPSVIHDGNQYVCYAICTYEKAKGTYFDNYSIKRIVSDNGPLFPKTTNSEYRQVNINGRPWGKDQEPWHLEVRKVDNLWFMLVATTDNGKYGEKSRLFLGQSKDGITFEFIDKPICNSVYTYKSSFWITNDPVNGKIYMQLWRTSSLNNWTMFYDLFEIKAIFK